MVAVEHARGTAETVLAEALPRRWNHVQGVGRKAERISPIVASSDHTTLIGAAWLHDVGYSPSLARTGFQFRSTEPGGSASVVLMSGFVPLWRITRALPTKRMSASCFS